MALSVLVIDLVVYVEPRLSVSDITRGASAANGGTGGFEETVTMASVDRTGVLRGRVLGIDAGAAQSLRDVTESKSSRVIT